MKQNRIIVTGLLLLSLLSGCQKTDDTIETESFTIHIICQSKKVYQIFYSCYFNDTYYGMGGMADYDKRELNESSSLVLTFNKAYFEGKEDLSGFSIDFSPYEKNDTSEAGTTNRITIDARYKEDYTIVLSGDREQGYHAELNENIPVISSVLHVQTAMNCVE